MSAFGLRRSQGLIKDSYLAYLPACTGWYVVAPAFLGHHPSSNFVQRKEQGRGYWIARSCADVALHGFQPEVKAGHRTQSMTASKRIPSRCLLGAGTNQRWGSSICEYVPWKENQEILPAIDSLQNEQAQITNVHGMTIAKDR